MLAAQADQLDTQDVMKWLMEAAACGHTFIHPEASLDVTRKVLAEITLEEVWPPSAPHTPQMGQKCYFGHFWARFVAIEKFFRRFAPKGEN